MQKTIKFGNQEFKLVSSGKTPIIYSNFMRRDFFKDFSEVIKFAEQASQEKEEGADMKTVISMFNSGLILKFLDFTWCYAKNADGSIPEIDEWLGSFEEFPILDILEDVIQLMMTSLSVKKNYVLKTNRKKPSM